jgi:hypothetical protein
MLSIGTMSANILRIGEMIVVLIVSIADVGPPLGYVDGRSPWIIVL